MTASLTEQAIATRELARRVRRLAGTLTVSADADQLLRYAEELDGQALELERRAQESG